MIKISQLNSGKFFLNIKFGQQNVVPLILW